MILKKAIKKVMKKDKLRTKFLGIYANLPLGLRKDIICVLDDWGTISWQVAYLEIKSETKVSWEILEYLKRLKII